MIPTQTIPESCLKTIREWTPAIARALKVVGLLNIQYCIQDDQVRLAPLHPPPTPACGASCLLHSLRIHRLFFAERRAFLSLVARDEREQGLVTSQECIAPSPG